MSFFGRSSSEKYLALDIGTEVVKALVFEISPKEKKGIILGVGKEFQMPGNMRSGAISHIQGVIESSKVAYKYKCCFEYNNKGFEMDYITNEFPSKEKMMLAAVSYALQSYENETFELFCDVYNYDDDNIELGQKRYDECNEIEYKLHHMLGETLFNRFAKCELNE